MSYHLTKIPKGKYGKYSKIEEEFLELQDAVKQEDKILQLCEICDLIGAIEAYVVNEFNMSLDDIIKFKNKTKKAFETGKRK